MDCKSVIVCFFLLISAASAATFNVGDKLGWTIPPLGDIAYRTWAAQQSFAVGDTLVFNFTAGFHNVAEVSKAAYDTCNTQSPISLSTSTPTNITLSSAGEHYYICTIQGHCGVGMKLAINVSGATTTTPAPQQPTPVSAPVSTPSSSVTHVVGDGLGWLVPPGGSIAYTTWASQQTFTQGDILVFNFTAGFHNVAEVSKAAYDTCNTQSPISFSTDTPTNITLTSAGEHYYICTVPRHCGLGMKLAINVSAATTTAPAQPPPVAPVSAPVPSSSPSSTQSPASSPSSTQSPAPSPSRTPATYMVGDGIGWIVPPGGPIAYQTWANEKTFIVGDKLVFNFTNGRHNVAQITSKADYDSCNTSSASTPITTSPAIITLTTPGEHFYFCTFPQHCFLGQKLAINVTGAPSSTATSPSVAPVSAPASAPVPSSSPSRVQSPAPSPSSTQSPASSPSSTQSPAPSPSRTPATYMVGDGIGWTVPPGGPIAYQTWANEKTFIVGDKLVFNFTNGRHNVAQITSKADYDSCNTSSASTPITTSPAIITLTTPGEHFYFCTFPQHCFLGQKLAINVTGAPSSTATSPSGSSTTTPSSSATSPSGSVPPSPSSASIVAVAALPFTLLSIAFTLFY